MKVSRMARRQSIVGKSSSGLLSNSCASCYLLICDHLPVGVFAGACLELFRITFMGKLFLVLVV